MTELRKIDCLTCGHENSSEAVECEICYSCLSEAKAKANQKIKNESLSRSPSASAGDTSTAQNRRYARGDTCRLLKQEPSVVAKNKSGLLNEFTALRDERSSSTSLKRTGKVETKDSNQKSVLRSKNKDLKSVGTIPTQLSKPRLSGDWLKNCFVRLQEQSKGKNNLDFEGIKDKKASQRLWTKRWVAGRGLPFAIFHRQNDALWSSAKIYGKRYDIYLKYIGIGLISVGVVMWANYFVVSPSAGGHRKFESQVAVPQGLFDYGGGTFFVPLVENGINLKIETAYPKFDLRYYKPLSDSGTGNAIADLIDGELSFAYSNRALKEEEYQRASLRKFVLEQTPIGIEGIVVYSNLKLAVERLNVDSLIQIFAGEITNWKQIDPEIDLAIIPVVIEGEDYDLPRYNKDSDKLIRVANYTQAIRQVIKTPGAISFSSTALVKKQNGIKILSLAASGSESFIAPFRVEEGSRMVNYEAIKDGSYPFTRKLFIVTRKDNTIEEQAGKAYSEYLKSPVGQEIIKKAGFVPIYY